MQFIYIYMYGAMLDFYLVIIIVNIVSLTEKLSTISTSFEFMAIRIIVCIMSASIH